MPLVLYAARALPTMKRGYSLVRKWNSLPAEQRADVQEQGRRAVVAIMAVKVAATAERSAGDPPATWEAAIQRVLHPGPAEEMAKLAVAYLQKVSEATADEIATAVGAIGKDDSTLKRAMSMARDDGYIRRVGVTFHGIKWDTTEWADLHLLDTPHVRQLEKEIVAFVMDFGIASLDHISGELGLEDDAPELLRRWSVPSLTKVSGGIAMGSTGSPRVDSRTSSRSTTCGRRPGPPRRTKISAGPWRSLSQRLRASPTP